MNDYGKLREKAIQNESKIENQQNLFIFLQFRDIGSCICNVTYTCKDFTK